MNINRMRYRTVAVAAALALAACSKQYPQRNGVLPTEAQDRISRNMYPALLGTIGQFANLAEADAMPIHVEGYGLVGNLPGTGSGDMDPKVREMLLDGLLRAGIGFTSTNTQNVSPEQIVSSNQVAAVEVRGLIPPMARHGSHFDLTINAVPNSQAVSLANGLLWTAPLKIIGLTTDGNDTAVIASGKGPVFISAPVQTAAGLAEVNRKALRAGRIIEGGICDEDRTIRLALNSASAMTTRIIERTINARFSGRDKYAQAENEQVVTLKIPPEFEPNPADFIEIVRHLYLEQGEAGFTEHKATELIEALKDPKAPRRDLSIALEALGRAILPDYLQPQYTAADPNVRFWCARAGAQMQDVGGMVVLQEMARDPASPYHRMALDEIVSASQGHDTVRATLTAAVWLNSSSTEERLAGYQALLKLKSPAVLTYKVARGFFWLDVVKSDGPTLIYVTQQDTPRIAILGRIPVLPPGAVYISPDRLLMVSVDSDSPTTSDAGQTSIVTASVVNAQPPATMPAKPATTTLFWRSPFDDQPVSLKTPPTLPEVVARLSYLPDPVNAGTKSSPEFIGATYQRVTEMLATLCHQQLIDAQFVLQKLPTAALSPEDLASGGRPDALLQATTAPASMPMTMPTTLPTSMK